MPKSRKELLLKPVWDYKDIMNYFGVKQTFAFKLKNRAIKEQDGGVKIGTQYVKTDSVLALYGTSRKEELELYGEEKELHQRDLQN